MLPGWPHQHSVQQGCVLCRWRLQEQWTKHAAQWPGGAAQAEGDRAQSQGSLQSVQTPAKAHAAACGQCQQCRQRGCVYTRRRRENMCEGECECRNANWAHERHIVKQWREHILKMQLIPHNTFVLFACLFREWFSAKPKDRCRRVTGQHALLAWEGLLQLCLQGLDPVGETFRWSGAHTQSQTFSCSAGLTLKSLLLGLKLF